jgi:Cytochrome c554 and c-prime
MIKNLFFRTFSSIFSIMAKIKKAWLIGSLFILLIFFCARCIQPRDTRPSGDPRGEAFAGSQACLKCHSNIGRSYLHSAHALTSAPGDSPSIKGPFTAGANELSYGPHGKVVLQHRDSGYFQQTFRGDRPGEAQRIDIAVGSGRKAQTYLYWKGDTVFQLPVSYSVSEKVWAGSPHYPTDTIWFGRIVSTECFECHASYIEKKRIAQTNVFHHIDRFERATVIYGIDCERCHGPGAAHVSWQETHPEDKQAKYMTAIRTLARQQKLDLCAVCHSGAHTEQRSLFKFRPGQQLADYLYAEPMRNPDPASMDVHGNQYQMLATSRCFLKSADLECTTCHDVHTRERDDLTVFARRCESCHQPGNIRTAAGGLAHQGMDSTALVTKCIDCHMPARPSRAITMQTAASRDPVADLVRTHYISVYR